MEYSGAGYLEFDSSFERAGDELASARRDQQFSKVTDAIDNFFAVETPVSNALRGTPAIRNDEQQAVLKGCLGFEQDEELTGFLKTLRSPEKKPLEDFFSSVQKTQILSDAGMAKGFRLLAKSYRSTGTVAEAMNECVSLLQDKFTQDEVPLIQKAIASLDFTLLLRFIANALSRVA